MSGCFSRRGPGGHRMRWLAAGRTRQAQCRSASPSSQRLTEAALPATASGRLRVYANVSCSARQRERQVSGSTIEEEW